MNLMKYYIIAIYFVKNNATIRSATEHQNMFWMLLFEALFL